MTASYKLQPIPSISRANYDPLSRSSSDSFEEFKDKPLPPRPASTLHRVLRPVYLVPLLALFLLCQLLFNNSYSSPPPFTVNTEEKIFIAANIVDESLILGAWGESLVQLVDLLGQDRVYVSIYGGPKSALAELSSKLNCSKSIVSEEETPLDLTRIPKTTIPTTGQEKMKRIAYLAEIRNMAILPLKTSSTKFDKVLFINDVFFTASHIPRLLWGTNVNRDTGKAEYKAACATDFVNSWKFYDTFATRDVEGYSIGVPLFPWFTGAGKAVSRGDVLAGRDNVRVKSCWGGMVVFDAKYFQHQSKAEVRTRNTETGALEARKTEPYKAPVTFRSWQPEPYWDASECCLIHADILAYSSSSADSTPSSETEGTEKDEYDTGIYMNPYIRVSYSQTTHNWVTFTARFERLFYPLATIINYFAGMPHFNPRRLEVEGQIIQDKHWVPNPRNKADPKPNKHHQPSDLDTRNPNPYAHPHAKPQSSPNLEARRNGVLSMRSNELHTSRKPASWWTDFGNYESFERTAQKGGYCVARQLLVVKERVRGEGDTGGMWDKLVDEVPPLGA